MTRYTPNWLQQGSYSAAMDRRSLAAIWPGPASAGCAVTVSSGMTVNVAAGQVAVPTQNSTGTSLCSSDAVEPVTLAAAPASGQNRYDLVICQPRGNDLDGGANNDFIFTTVTGTAAATPTVPATPAGTVALARIYVPGGSASVTAGNITDVRPFGLNLKPAANTVLARAWRNAPFTAAAGGQQLSLDSVSFDPAGMVNAGQFTVPVAGYYQVASMVTVAATVSGDRTSTQVYQNGAVVTSGALAMASIAANFGSAGVDIVRCAAGDVLGLGLYVSAGRVVVPGATATFLAITLLAVTA